MTSLLSYLKARPRAATAVATIIVAGLICIGFAIFAGKKSRRPEGFELLTQIAAGRPPAGGPTQFPLSVDPKAMEQLQQYQRALGAAAGVGAREEDALAGLPGAHPPVSPSPIIIKGESLAKAFNTGELPAPLPQPQGTLEQIAAQLSKRVIADDEQSTAALLTAVRMSGFSVRADDGSLAIESVKPGQGMVIEAWEAAGLAKLYGEDMQVSLADLSRTLTGLLAPREKIPFDILLMDGIRTAAQSKQPTRRFWADFIVELGRQSSTPYDLLAPHVDSTTVTLDPIQLSLILRRLTADVMIANNRSSRRAQWMQDLQSSSNSERAIPVAFRPTGRSRHIVQGAVWRVDRLPRLVQVAEGGGAGLPCTLSEFASKFVDANAYADAFMYDKILDRLAEHGSEGAEGFKGGTAAANALLALIKLYVFFASLETNVEMEGSPPLVRTQSIYTPGEKRKLTATVRENIGKWQMLNCTRIMLNGVNLDFSLPSDGPVAGVRTGWQLAAGGTSVHNNQITRGFVEFVAPNGTPLIQTAMVPISNPAAPLTDEEGHTHIDIEGLKQPAPLRNPIPVMKQAEVRFSVAPKAANMSQDLVDAVGLGASPGIGTLVGGVVETALRSNLHLSKTLYIPVKDWRSCRGGWGGTASFRSTNETVENIDTAQSKTVNTTNTIEGATIKVEADPSAVPSASGSATGTHTSTYSLTGNMVTVWPPVRNFTGGSVNKQTTITADGGGAAEIMVMAITENEYQISLKLEGEPLHGTFRTHATCSGQVCSRARTDPDEERPFEIGMVGVSFKAKADPSHPEKLFGSTALNDTPAAGWSTEVHWDLMQCEGDE